MNTYTAVVQIGANTFDVFKFSAPTKSSLYPQTSKRGIAVAIFESNAQNDKYCFSLCEQMNESK